MNFVFKYGINKGKTPSEVKTAYLQYLAEEAYRTYNAVKEELESRKEPVFANHLNYADYHKDL